MSVTMKVGFGVDEEYPSYSVIPEPQDGDHLDTRVFDVPRHVLARWQRIEREHQAMRQEIKNLLDPPCPECDHPQARHQEWSKGWDTWGCLANTHGDPVRRHTCRCQHGKPEGR